MALTEHLRTVSVTYWKGKKEHLIFCSKNQAPSNKACLQKKKLVVWPLEESKDFFPTEKQSEVSHFKTLNEHISKTLLEYTFPMRNTKFAEYFFFFLKVSFLTFKT